MIVQLEYDFWDYEFLDYKYGFMADCPKGYKVHDNKLCGEQKFDVLHIMRIMLNMYIICPARSSAFAEKPRT